MRDASSCPLSIHRRRFGRRLAYQNEAIWALGNGLTSSTLVIYLALITRSELKYDRYLIPMLPVLDIMAAIGLVAGWHWLTVRTARLGGWGWTVALLVLISQMALTFMGQGFTLYCAGAGGCGSLASRDGTRARPTMPTTPRNGNIHWNIFKYLLLLGLMRSIISSPPTGPTSGLY